MSTKYTSQGQSTDGTVMMHAHNVCLYMHVCNTKCKCTVTIRRTVCLCSNYHNFTPQCIDHDGNPRNSLSIASKQHIKEAVANGGVHNKSTLLRTRRCFMSVCHTAPAKMNLSNSSSSCRSVGQHKLSSSAFAVAAAAHVAINSISTPDLHWLLSLSRPAMTHAADAWYV